MQFLIADPTEDLLDAALNGDLRKAEAAIKAGADVNGKDIYGETALILASKNDQQFCNFQITVC